MKTGTKKFLYTIFTVILALGLGIGAILLSMLNVQASTEMMPGIEQILDEKSEETPFRILVLVNNSADAEIGYHIALCLDKLLTLFFCRKDRKPFFYRRKSLCLPFRSIGICRSVFVL